MKNIVLVFLLFLVSATAFAQAGTKSFLVTPREDGWGILHNVAPGETIFSLARQFHIPPAIIAEANGLTYNDGLQTDATIFLPLGNYNQKAALPAGIKGTALLLYKMRAQDQLYLVSRHASVPQRTLMQWNSLKDGDALTGKTIMVGAVLYDDAVGNEARLPAIAPLAKWQPSNTAQRQDSIPKYRLAADTFSTPPVIARYDSTRIVKPVNTLESLFAGQTLNGKNMVVEKGSAGFYQLTGNAPGAASFAFHNAAARGTVIRVKNIGNGRVVYVKVLGPVPGSKQYAGCAIGLSSTAKRALDVQEGKAFVEMSYAGY